MIDPIYQDISKEALAAQVAREESEKALDGFKKALEKAPPRTIERRNAEDDIKKESERLLKLVQIEEYNNIRVARRKAEDHRNYKIAFAADTPWPDPKELEAYLVNKRLVKASKNWSDRVPKFTTGFNSAPAAEVPTKSKSSEGGGGEGGGGGTKEGIHHN